ncbi:hypothetical protein BMS3Abin11_02489 [bacterium BMS3Abin11]|nr:hypothetical protein BMS3Abin11_02489 [bacterium BMS3Abin11]
MKQHNDDKCKPNQNVKVLLNGDKVKIKSGTYIVSDLKASLGTPSDYELEIVKDGELIPLSDNDEITICGKEVFISHVKCGGSS